MIFDIYMDSLKHKIAAILYAITYKISDFHKIMILDSDTNEIYYYTGQYNLDEKSKDFWQFELFDFKHKNYVIGDNETCFDYASRKSIVFYFTGYRCRGFIYGTKDFFDATVYKHIINIHTMKKSYMFEVIVR